MSLSKKLDLSTLDILGSSHEMKVDLTENRELFFIFKDINLADSFHNEPASHGHITFRIKALSTINLNDEILNKADIYFDYNPPITTEVALSRYALKSTIGIQSSYSPEISMYPNPVSDLIVLNLPESIKKLKTEIYDLNGKLILENENKRSIDVSKIGLGIYILQINIGDKRYQLKFEKR